MRKYNILATLLICSTLLFGCGQNSETSEKTNGITKEATAEIKKLSNSDYLVDMAKGKRAYNLDSTLGTSYSNNPQYMNIKNDYVV